MVDILIAYDDYDDDGDDGITTLLFFNVDIHQKFSGVPIYRVFHF